MLDVNNHRRVHSCCKAHKQLILLCNTNSNIMAAYIKSDSYSVTAVFAIL